jgi:hypothetical protein
MGLLGLKLILQTPWIGFVALAFLFVLERVSLFPSAPTVLIGATVLGWLGAGLPTKSITFGLGLPGLVIPNWEEVSRSFSVAVLPQMTLTLTNAVIVTASLARELFPASRLASERNLAISSGLANLLLSPFGAMPMCHGAGGL